MQNTWAHPAALLAHRSAHLPHSVLNPSSGTMPGWHCHPATPPGRVPPPVATQQPGQVVPSVWGPARPVLQQDLPARRESSLIRGTEEEGNHLSPDEGYQLISEDQQPQPGALIPGVNTASSPPPTALQSSLRWEVIPVPSWDKALYRQSLLYLSRGARWFFSSSAYMLPVSELPGASSAASPPARNPKVPWNTV